MRITVGRVGYRSFFVCDKPSNCVAGISAPPKSATAADRRPTVLLVLAFQFAWSLAHSVSRVPCPRMPIESHPTPYNDWRISRVDTLPASPSPSWRSWRSVALVAPGSFLSSAPCIVGPIPCSHASSSRTRVAPASAPPTRRPLPAVAPQIQPRHCRSKTPESAPGGLLTVVHADDQYPASLSCPSGSSCMRIQPPVQAHLV